MEVNNEQNQAVAKQLDKQDSIEVSRNQKGVYSFKIKRYWNPEHTQAEHIIESMKSIEETLLEKFPDKGA
jgi:hypothetical protein